MRSAAITTVSVIQNAACADTVSAGVASDTSVGGFAFVTGDVAEVGSWCAVTPSVNPVECIAASASG